MKCKHCGEEIADESKFCVFCGNKITTENKGKSLWLLWSCLAVALIVGGIFSYYNIIMPKKRDAEALRYYTIATSVNLRSSRSSGGAYNKIKSLPYGTALITYEVGPEWLTVKTDKSPEESEQYEGYVYAMYALNKHDFFLLNSIWGDKESQEVIHETRHRRALLSYYKDNNYIGVISNEDRIDAGITVKPSANNQWQVFSKSKGSKQNTSYFDNLIDEDSKYKDFAVIIKNINTGDRKLLYFYYRGDDETPILFGEYDVNRTGYIKKIKKTPYGLEVYTVSRTPILSYHTDSRTSMTPLPSTLT